MLAKWLGGSIPNQRPEQAKPAPADKKQLWLPGNLGGLILDLQFTCEGESVNKQMIARLCDLYTQAVQFYQEAGCAKYKVYQKRMINFLKKPSIEEILNGKSGDLASKKEATEKNVIKASITSKDQMNKLMKRSEKRATSNKLLIDKEIQGQEKKLEERINKRRTMSNKSTRTGPDGEDLNQEQGAGQIKVKGKETMNMKLILDDIIDRKIKRVFL